MLTYVPLLDVRGVITKLRHLYKGRKLIITVIITAPMRLDFKMWDKSKEIPQQKSKS